MKQSNRGVYSGRSWKEIEKVISIGRARGTVFEDWLDLMLFAFLSATDNERRENFDPTKWDGPYEAAYMQIVERYPSNRPRGERPIDHFQNATGELIKELARDGSDCLGEIFESEISYGEHGQFFTPQPVADLIASITAPSNEGMQAPRICDPACGSGRMLLAAHKVNPLAFLIGVDLDHRCAKMFALNLILRNIDGDAYCGDTLAMRMRTVWRVRGGYVEVEHITETPKEVMQPTLF